MRGVFEAHSVFLSLKLFMIMIKREMLVLFVEQISRFGHALTHADIYLFISYDYKGNRKWKEKIHSSMRPRHPRK